MTRGTKIFLLGAVTGIAAAAIIKSDLFRKGCAKIAAAGMQLKDDAAEFLETVKEDAEDVQAEKKTKAEK